MVRAVALFAGCAAGLPLAAGFGSAPPMGSLMRSRPVSHRPMRRASPTTMVATPLEQPKVKIPDYTGWTDLSQAPPFSLKDMQQSIPAHLWEKNAAKSLYYLAKDVVIVAALAGMAITLNNPLVWPLYWLAQGTMFWALFVIGHDCGHVENDESWYPTTKKSFDELNDPNGDLMTKIGAWVRFSFIGNLIAYPLYLLNRSPGRLSGSHYDWNFTREKTGDSDALFRDSERGQVATSTASLAAMVGLLVGLGAKFGAGFVFATWVMPYLVFVAWLDLVTYLHHTDKDLPWYRDPEWTYLRGGLTTTG